MTAMADLGLVTDAHALLVELAVASTSRRASGRKEPSRA